MTKYFLVRPRSPGKIFCPHQFKICLPANLCQSVDFFDTANIQCKFTFGFKIWGILRIRWSKIKSSACFHHQTHLEARIFAIFQRFSNFLGHFVNLGELSTKIKVETAGQVQDRFTAVCPTKTCTRALSNVNIAYNGKNRYLYLQNNIIPKKLCEMPKNPIIWLWPLSGRGYQVMSTFRLGFPDPKVAWQ